MFAGWNHGFDDRRKFFDITSCFFLRNHIGPDIRESMCNYKLAAWDPGPDVIGRSLEALLHHTFNVKILENLIKCINSMQELLHVNKLEREG